MKKELIEEKHEELDDIDKLLRMENKTIAPKVSPSKKLTKLSVDQEDDDDEDDWEEVEMKHDTLNQDVKLSKEVREKGIEIHITDAKKAKKRVDMATKMAQLFKTLQKKFQIAIIKSHLVCWMAHGFYLNKICLNEEVRAFAMSQDKFRIDKFQLCNFDKEILSDFIKKVNDLLTLPEKDEFLSRNTLITNESLIEAISKLEFSCYLEYILFIIILLRNLDIKVRLSICFDVATVKEEKQNENKAKSSKSAKGKKKDSDEEDESDELELSDEENNKKS